MKTVLAGGCFDILHLGHIVFLEKAKKQGDRLVVLIEGDKSVRRLKGPGRPINKQRDRAKLVSFLKPVDQVILLTDNMRDQDYDELVGKIKPAVLATTKGDPNIDHKKRQAKLVGAKVLEVSSYIKGYSSSELAKRHS